MKHRELLFLTVGLALLGALVVLVTGGGSMPLHEPAEVAGEPDPMEPVEEPGPVAAPVPAETVVATVGEREDGPPVDTAGWTSGVILGDIRLAVSILDRIQSISVTVTENRQPGRVDGVDVRPYQRTIGVSRGVGTPTFEIRDVPFSPYGYTVRATSPGLNGSAQTVLVNERQPYQEVLLGLMPGVPYSILLRDQDQNPVTGTDVTMAAVGDPPGRPLYKGTTDNYGSLLFEDVLAGGYRVFVGHVEQPLTEPVDVTVQPPGRTFRAGQPVRGQSCRIEVPRGVDLVVETVDARNYGVAGVALKLLATDSVRLKVLEGETDFAGRYTFHHVPPGSYQLDASKPDYSRRTVTVSFQKGELPPTQVIRITPIR